MTPSQILLCVPARLASSRLPEKLLADLGGQSVIAHVCDRLAEVKAGLEQSFGKGVQTESLVLTDSPRIAECVEKKGATARLSKREHDSGSSRIREYVSERWAAGSLSKDALVVNVQGDEPFLDSSDVVSLVTDFCGDPAGDLPVGTLVHRNTDKHDFLDPSVVKVVRRGDGRALYFSRAPVPWPRDALGVTPLGERGMEAWNSWSPAEGWGFWHHLGIYVYRAVYLLSKQDVPHGFDSLHEIEALEQLEVLLAGQGIWITEAKSPSCGIDTARDLEQARLQLAKNKSKS